MDSLKDGVWCFVFFFGGGGFEFGVFFEVFNVLFIEVGVEVVGFF